MTHGRPPRKPRWKPTADTIGIARHYAAKPKPEDVEDIVDILLDSFDAMRTCQITQLQFTLLNGATDTARAIEKQRVVKGLTTIIDAAKSVIDTIWERYWATGAYVPTALHAHELTAMREFVTLHAYQIRQLSRAEYLRAVESARGRIGPTGLVLYSSQAQAATA